MESTLVDVDLDYFFGIDVFSVTNIEYSKKHE